VESTAQLSRIDRVRSWLPRGDTLDAKAFQERHRTLSILLGLHIPVLAVFGISMGQGVAHSLIEAGATGVFLGLALIPAMPRRFKGILVSAGLVWCSAVLVHFSGGYIEAHFHFFIILGFIALYQDWAAFGWAIIFTALSHGLGSQLGPDLMFNHGAAIEQPWTWALIHAGMVLFAAVGQIIGWRHAETAQDRATHLTTQLVREQAERQASYSRIYVNLARRTQSLLHRQLSVIDDLEDSEEDPDTLRKLFQLDHLTTRVRRNAESLLVMAGEDSPRRWNAPVALADIARAAASEIEQYERADIRVADPVAVAGTAVVDVTHLLAELIENAAEYSAPTTTVVVGGYATLDGAVLTIEDHGIGMSQEDLDAANATLLDPPELDDEVVRHLGFQVVARLARKLGMKVQLRPTVGGGITAVVEMPSTLLAHQDPPGADAPAVETEVAAPAAPAPVVTSAEAPAAPQAAAPEPAPVADQSASDDLATISEHATTQPSPTAQVEPPPPPAAAPPAQPPSAAPVAQESPSADRPRSNSSNGAAAGLPMLFMAKQPLSADEPSPTNGHGQSNGQHHATGTAPTAASAPSPAAPAPGPAPTPSGNGASAGPSDLPRTPAHTSPAGPGDPTLDTDIDPFFDDLFDQPGPSAATGPPTAPASPAAPAAPRSPSPLSNGLPQRTPAASLAAGLREAFPERHEETTAPPEARQALSAFQAASRAGRDAAARDDSGEDH
jgi:signal transduction histidine kinase